VGTSETLAPAGGDTPVLVAGSSIGTGTDCKSALTGWEVGDIRTAVRTYFVVLRTLCRAGGIHCLCELFEQKKALRYGAPYVIILNIDYFSSKKNS
jgi:hypothetical protein